MNLNQVTLPALDVEASIRFYEILGLRLIVQSLPAYARFECPEGGASFSVHQVNDLPEGEGAWIYFEVANLDGYVQGLVRNGIKFEQLPTDQPWLWREARLRDPSNNRLILYFAGDNRLHPPWRLKR